MAFKAVALDDLRQPWGGLFRAVSVQLYSVAPGAGIPGNGGKRYAFSSARVQSGNGSAGNRTRFRILSASLCGKR